jgi:hypothetical protein
MALITTFNLDDMNKSNQINSDLIMNCLSGLNSFPSSKDFEYVKSENNLAEDNYYSRNISIEFIEKNGIDFIKYFKHQLIGCLGQLDSSLSGYQMEALEVIYQLENPAGISNYLKDKDELDGGIVFHVT